MVVDRPRVRCLAARLTTLAVRSLTLLPTFTQGRSRPMQSQLTNAARSCQMCQPPRKLDYPNSRPCPGLRYLLQGARRGRFWTSSAIHSTRPWMIKKSAVVFPTWAATFPKKPDADSKRSRRRSKTKSLAGPPSSKRRTLIDKKLRHGSRHEGVSCPTDVCFYPSDVSRSASGPRSPVLIYGGPGVFSLSGSSLTRRRILQLSPSTA